MKYQIKTEDELVAGNNINDDELRVSLNVGLPDFHETTSFIITDSGIFCGNKEQGFVSIKTASGPEKFWRHYEGYLYLHDREAIDNSPGKNNDACWKIVKKPICSDSAVSFYSRNFPNRAITKCEKTNRLHNKPENDNCGNITNKCWLLEPIDKGKYLY